MNNESGNLLLNVYKGIQDFYDVLVTKGVLDIKKREMVLKELEDEKLLELTSSFQLYELNVILKNNDAILTNDTILTLQRYFNFNIEKNIIMGSRQFGPQSDITILENSKTRIELDAANYKCSDYDALLKYTTKEIEDVLNDFETITREGDEENYRNSFPYLYARKEYLNKIFEKFLKYRFQKYPDINMSEELKKDVAKSIAILGYISNNRNFENSFINDNIKISKNLQVRYIYDFIKIFYFEDKKIVDYINDYLDTEYKLSFSNKENLEFLGVYSEEDRQNFIFEYNIRNLMKLKFASLYNKNRELIKICSEYNLNVNQDNLIKKITIKTDEDNLLITIKIDKNKMVNNDKIVEELSIWIKNELDKIFSPVEIKNFNTEINIDLNAIDREMKLNQQLLNISSNNKKINKRKI